MNKRILILSSMMVGIGFHLVAQDKKLPNIVFILADDLGYGDLSYLNEKGKIKTPNLDRMAENGVVFNDAHSSSAVSTPSRYGILTGRYNWRSTLKNGVLGWYDKPLIAGDRTTMASMLRNQGYHTACIGKWHLGMNFPTKDGEKPVDTPDAYNLDFSKEITGGPCDVGFEYFFGVDAPNYPPYCFIETRHTMGMPDFYYPLSKEMDSRPGRGLANWKMEEILPALEEKAVTYITQAASNEDPFFLYIPLTSPHTPIVPTDEFADQSKLNKYADFVMQSDAVVGNIMKALADNNIADNTIIVFTSDNGCSPQADFKLLAEKGHNPSYIFRGMKSDLFEGGHHIPCIVSWPSEINHHRVDQTISLIDFMATFACITGYELSDDEAEDSYNILPLLIQADYKPKIREATVYHSIRGDFTICKGDWKLLLSPSSGGWSFPKPGNDDELIKTLPSIQLYNMKDDPAETNNVYAEYPEIVNELKALMTKYVKEGRSTPGIPQKNDGPEVWRQLSWMK